MTFEVPTEPASLEPAPPRLPGVPAPSLRMPISVIAAGVLLIGVMALAERAVTPDVPWSDSLLILGEESPVDDAIPVRLRKVPEDNYTQNPIVRQLRAMPESREALAELGLEEPKRERIALLSAPPERWEDLLESGRLPRRGEPEVLAGELARLDSFALDGRTFRVVGRIRREVSPFIFSFVLPDDPAMRPYFEEAEKGWLVSADTVERIGRLAPDDPEWEGVQIVGGFARIPAFLTLGAIAGLAIASLGGAILLARLLRRFERSVPLFIRPVFAEVGFRPGLYWGLHAVSYGAWFVCMLLALAFPLANLLLVQVVQNVFVSGELEYVGRAYASGNVLVAALATFKQNFFTATLLTGILPSLIFPFWEVFKNFLSFSILGFAMSPIWADRIPGYTYHSITVVMELEAYILAAFIISAWPLRILDAFRSGEVRHIGWGLTVVASGTVLVALILFAAALYEATTLILLS